MISLYTKELKKGASRKLLSGSIAPRPIALISTLQENGLVNMAPFSWFNMVSGEPPLLSVSVRYDTDTQKDTSVNILRNKEFVVHIISRDFLEKANITSTSLSREESELELAGFEAVESSLIKTPGVKEARVRLECVYENHLALESTDLIIGRVVAFHIDEEIYKDGKIDVLKLDPVSRIAGKRYNLLGEIIHMD